MNFLKKAAAFMTACTMLSAAALPAQAADETVHVSIDQVELTLDELADMNHRVLVHIWLEENPGVNAIEFGVNVDERCTYEISTDFIPETADGEVLLTSMTTSSEGPLSWLVWASASVMDNLGPMVRFYVTLPEDAAPGDKYTLNYVDEYYSIHQWNDNINSVRYGELGAVEWTDGYIAIVGDGDMPDKKGDVNCDGIVNVLDVIVLNKNLLGGGSLTAQGVLNANVDGDSTPTAADSLLILKSIIGLADLG